MLDWYFKLDFAQFGHYSYHFNINEVDLQKN